MKTKQQLLKFKTKMDAKLHELEKKRDNKKRSEQHQRKLCCGLIFSLLHLWEDQKLLMAFII